MRYARGHKATTRQRILGSAARLFTARGYAATSIDDVMRGCGLTRGAFYAHFASKAELYREAVRRAGAQGGLAADPTGRAGDDAWIAEALDGAGEGAGLAFLAKDLASDQPEVRRACGGAIRLLSRRLLGRAGSAPGDEATVLSVLAMVVGAMSLAQTIGEAALRERLFAACRERARAMLERGAELPCYFWEPAR